YVERGVPDDLPFGVLGVPDIPVRHLHKHFARRAAVFWETMRHVASDHVAHDAVFAQAVPGVERGDRHAVADDGDRVGDVTHFAQLVGNDDAGDALGLQLQHEIEEFL